MLLNHTVKKRVSASEKKDRDMMQKVGVRMTKEVKTNDEMCLTGLNKDIFTMTNNDAQNYDKVTKEVVKYVGKLYDHAMKRHVLHKKETKHSKLVLP